MIKIEYTMIKHIIQIITYNKLSIHIVTFLTNPPNSICLTRIIKTTFVNAMYKCNTNINANKKNEQMHEINLNNHVFLPSHLRFYDINK